jgi:hypothetical protein
MLKKTIVLIATLLLSNTVSATINSFKKTEFNITKTIEYIKLEQKNINYLLQQNTLTKEEIHHTFSVLFQLEYNTFQELNKEIQRLKKGPRKPHYGSKEKAVVLSQQILKLQKTHNTLINFIKNNQTLSALYTNYSHKEKKSKSFFSTLVTAGIATLLITLSAFTLVGIPLNMFTSGVLYLLQNDFFSFAISIGIVAIIPIGIYMTINNIKNRDYNKDQEYYIIADSSL